MTDFAWEIFLKTGSVESYLLYKELTEKNNGLRQN